MPSKNAVGAILDYVFVLADKSLDLLVGPLLFTMVKVIRDPSANLQSHAAWLAFEFILDDVVNWRSLDSSAVYGIHEPQSVTIPSLLSKAGLREGHTTQQRSTTEWNEYLVANLVTQELIAEHEHRCIA